jgi:hypothetical protein
MYLRKRRSRRISWGHMEIRDQQLSQNNGVIVGILYAGAELNDINIIVDVEMKIPDILKIQERRLPTGEVDTNGLV